ncbi:MAG: hypothetical protein ABIR96_04870 [Bdellovibrionota bacterium]
MGLLNDKVKLVGFDVFVVNQGLPKIPEKIEGLTLSLISNRGTKVWPGPTPNINLTDVHRCRFIDASRASLTHADALKLLAGIDKAGFEWVHVEKLIEINGKAGFSKAQGE